VAPEHRDRQLDRVGLSTGRVEEVLAVGVGGRRVLAVGDLERRRDDVEARPREAARVGDVAPGRDERRARFDLSPRRSSIAYQRSESGSISST
jgi:hypothetical protein